LIGSSFFEIGNSDEQQVASCQAKPDRAWVIPVQRLSFHPRKQKESEQTTDKASATAKGKKQQEEKAK